MTDRRELDGLRIRPSARAVDHRSRGSGPARALRVPRGTVWATPGGGQEPGEDDEATIRRELDEEVGLRDVVIGAHLWTRVVVVPFLDGSWDGQRERVYLVATPPFVPQPTMSWEQLLAEHVHELRWWTADELLDAARDGVWFAPRQLPALVADLARQRPAVRAARDRGLNRIGRHPLLGNVRPMRIEVNGIGLEVDDPGRRATGAPAPRLAGLAPPVAPPDRRAPRGRVPNDRPRPARVRCLGPPGRRRRLQPAGEPRRRRRGPRPPRRRTLPRGRPRLGRGAGVGRRRLPPRPGRPPRRPLGRPSGRLRRRRLGAAPAVLVHAPVPVRGHRRAVAVDERMGQLPGLLRPPRGRRRHPRPRARPGDHHEPQLVPRQRRPAGARRGAADGARCGGARDGRVERRRPLPHRGPDDELGPARQRDRSATRGSPAPATGCSSSSRPPSTTCSSTSCRRPDGRARSAKIG